MKKYSKNISSPEELNKYLQHSSLLTWIILGVVGAILISFFTFSFIYKVDVKLTGSAIIKDKEVTLNIAKNDLKKVKVGQKVYINSLEGIIEEVKPDEQPIVSYFPLDDGTYDYKIILKQMRLIDFLIG